MHVFLLLVYLGVGEDRVRISNDMYFRSILDCNFYAAQVSKRYGNYSHTDWMDSRDRVTAYCVPKFINPDYVRVY
jgi:hypothetical protein